MTVAAVVVAVLCVAGCGDDDKVFDPSLLGGTWERVWDKGVQDVGTERYTFRPTSQTEGTVEVFTSDVFTGDKTTLHDYVVGHTGHIVIYGTTRQAPFNPGGEECDIARLTRKEMVWNHTDSKEVVKRFRRVE